MTALEVIGAAGIWAFFISCGLFLAVVGLYIAACLLDRWRIHRAMWSFKEWKWLSEDELNDYLRDHAQDWWRGVKHHTSWCREQDYEAGMRAAAKHLIRDHMSIIKPRARMFREMENLRDELTAAKAELGTSRYFPIPGTNMSIRRCQECGRADELPIQVQLVSCSKCTAEEKLPLAEKQS